VFRLHYDQVYYWSYSDITESLTVILSINFILLYIPWSAWILGVSRDSWCFPPTHESALQISQNSARVCRTVPVLCVRQ